MPPPFFGYSSDTESKGYHYPVLALPWLRLGLEGLPLRRYAAQR